MSLYYREGCSSYWSSFYNIYTFIHSAIIYWVTVMRDTLFRPGSYSPEQGKNPWLHDTYILVKYGTWRLKKTSNRIASNGDGVYAVGVVNRGWLKVTRWHFSVVGASEQRPDWSKWMSEENIWVKFFLGRGNCKHKCPEMGTSLVGIHLTYSKSKSASIPASNNQVGELGKWCEIRDKKVDGDWGKRSCSLS